MSTFTCQELADSFNWGACPCNWSPMPIVGSVSNSTFPYSTYGWTQQNKAFAKNECCDIACQIAQNANPLSLLQGPTGGSAVPIGVDKGDKRTIARNPMRSATGKPFLCHCGCTGTYDPSQYGGAIDCSCCKEEKRAMRSATGGGKNKVATAVNWLTSLI